MAEARILIVEDENIVAMDIKHRLKNLGYSVVGWATTGPEAIDQAAKTSPDLILMDIRLKGEMDGITASERIRSCHDIPVIYLTAYSDEATMQRARTTEPYGYLLKPFADRDLHSTIAVALHRYKVEQELKETRSFRLRSRGRGDLGQLPQQRREV
jgi:CheY-like chemotaxis protein